MDFSAVFDRTEQDVLLADDLVEKIKNNGYDLLTSEEKALWESGLKGRLNVSDLNRIENNCSILADKFSITLNTKTWVNTDFPTESQMDRILNNIGTLRTNFLNTNAGQDIPEVPIRPINTIDKLNTVEKILYLINLYF